MPMDENYHMTTLRLPKDTVLKLKMQAGLERKSMTALISELCELGLSARSETNADRIEQFKKYMNHVA